MTSEWQDIETAPKDGTRVRLKRVYQRRLVAEGIGSFDMLADNAPSRRGQGPDPLGRMSDADYERERVARNAWVSTPKWVTEDRRYCFPDPTHWAPNQSGGQGE